MVQGSILGGTHLRRMRRHRCREGVYKSARWVCASESVSPVQIIQLTPSRRPFAVLTLDSSPSQTSSSDTPSRNTQSSTADSDAPTPFAITSVAWAPSCGRSYHLIATGGRDGRVRIWRVRPPVLSDELDGESEGDAEGKWAASIVGEFDDHK